MTAPHHTLSYSPDWDDATPPQVFSFAALKEAAAPLQQYRESDKEDALLANADRFTLWLCGCCVGARQVEIGYIPRDAGELAERIEAADVPTLAAMLHYPRVDVIVAAAHELSLRYLAAHGVTK